MTLEINFCVDIHYLIYIVSNNFCSPRDRLFDRNILVFDNNFLKLAVIKESVETHKVLFNTNSFVLWNMFPSYIINNLLLDMSAKPEQTRKMSIFWYTIQHLKQTAYSSVTKDYEIISTALDFVNTIYNDVLKKKTLAKECIKQSHIDIIKTYCNTNRDLWKQLPSLIKNYINKKIPPKKIYILGITYLNKDMLFAIHALSLYHEINVIIISTWIFPETSEKFLELEQIYNCEEDTYMPISETINIIRDMEIPIKILPSIPYTMNKLFSSHISDVTINLNYPINIWGKDNMINTLQSVIVAGKTLYTKFEKKDCCDDKSSFKIYECEHITTQIILAGEIIQSLIYDDKYNPDSIVLVVPDIKPYFSMVHSIFTSTYCIPFVNIEEIPYDNNMALRGFLTLIDILTTHKFNIYQVLDLLSYPTTMNNWHFSEQELEILSSRINQILKTRYSSNHIYWKYILNIWTQEILIGNGILFSKNTYVSTGDINDFEIIEKFNALVEHLEQEQDKLIDKTYLSTEWKTIIHELIVNTFLSSCINNDSHKEFSKLFSIIEIILDAPSNISCLISLKFIKDLLYIHAQTPIMIPIHFNSQWVNKVKLVTIQNYHKLIGSTVIFVAPQNMDILTSTNSSTSLISHQMHNYHFILTILMSHNKFIYIDLTSKHTYNKILQDIMLLIQSIYGEHVNQNIIQPYKPPCLNPVSSISNQSKPMIELTIKDIMLEQNNTLHTKDLCMLFCSNVIPIIHRVMNLKPLFLEPVYRKDPMNDISHNICPFLVDVVRDQWNFWLYYFQILPTHNHNINYSQLDKEVTKILLSAYYPHINTLYKGTCLFHPANTFIWQNNSNTLNMCNISAPAITIDGTNIKSNISTVLFPDRKQDMVSKVIAFLNIKQFIKLDKTLSQSSTSTQQQLLQHTINMEYLYLIYQLYSIPELRNKTKYLIINPIETNFINKVSDTFTHAELDLQCKNQNKIFEFFHNTITLLHNEPIPQHIMNKAKIKPKNKYPTPPSFHDFLIVPHE